MRSFYPNSKIKLNGFCFSTRSHFPGIMGSSVDVSSQLDISMNLPFTGSIGRRQIEPFIQPHFHVLIPKIDNTLLSINSLKTHLLTKMIVATKSILASDVFAIESREY